MATTDEVSTYGEQIDDVSIDVYRSADHALACEIAREQK